MAGCPSPEAWEPPGWDLGLPCASAPIRPRGAGSSSSLAGGSDLGPSRPLGQALAAGACLGRASYSSLGKGGCGSRWRVWESGSKHFPPDLCVLGKPPSRPCLLFAFARALERGWGDLWCGGARRWGRRWRRWSQADRASCGLGDGTSARPGGGGGSGAGAARLAASGGGGAAGRSPSVFAPGWGALRRCRKLTPRPQPPSPPASLAAPWGRTEAHVLIGFYEGSPWPSLPFWDWSGCVSWSWGSADHPAPGKAFVLFRRGVSLQNRPLGASVSPSVDWGYNFS